MAKRIKKRPDNVIQNLGDMFWYRTERTPEGRISMTAQRVCEDCWEDIPRYKDFPYGLTSPESDGDAGGNFAKRRASSAEGLSAVEALRKSVCLKCYLKSFRRVYPEANLPKLSKELMSA
jgi:hypothetical protein